MLDRHLQRGVRARAYRYRSRVAARCAATGFTGTSNDKCDALGNCVGTPMIVRRTCCTTRNEAADSRILLDVQGVRNRVRRRQLLHHERSVQCGRLLLRKHVRRLRNDLCAHVHSRARPATFVGDCQSAAREVTVRHGRAATTTPARAATSATARVLHRQARISVQ